MVRPPLNVFSPLHMFAVVVPNASDIVFAVFCIGYVNVSAACLLLNSDQSDEVRRPRDEADAVGIFNVCVPVDDVVENPNPPSTDVVAKYCIGFERPFNDFINPRDDVAVSV